MPPDPLEDALLRMVPLPPPPKLSLSIISPPLYIFLNETLTSVTLYKGTQ